jgi:hypothetical protein
MMEHYARFQAWGDHLLAAPLGQWTGADLFGVIGLAGGAVFILHTAYVTIDMWNQRDRYY